MPAAASTADETHGAERRLFPTGGAATDYEQYRVLSIFAVASLILAIVSLPALLFVQLAFLPFFGLILGLRAISSIRKQPEELTGMRLALIGTVLSGLLFCGSLGIFAVIYVTEVPEGYTRISFLDLQPTEDREDLPVSPQALELSGKKVFVKGYVYPDDSGGELQRFVLVPDMGTCCFGGQPKLTDMIEVTLQDPLRIRYSYARRRLGGVLKVDTKKKPVSGLDGVYYQLEADYVK